MIFPCQFFADGALHQTRQGRQYIDGRVDLSVVQLTIDENLALSDVASQIRNRMCYIYNFAQEGANERSAD